MLPGADSSAAAAEGSVSVLRWPPSLLPGAPLSLERNQNNKAATIPRPSFIEHLIAAKLFGVLSKQ